MRVWLIHIGEPLPLDRGSPRLARVGMLAEILHGRGHDVLWWASTFEYRNKTHRSDVDTLCTVRAGYRIRLLHGRGFSKHVSLDRILYHRDLARSLKRAMPKEVLPDIILCGYPTIELSVAAVSFGQRRGIPVVLDVRDLWPDIFVRALPKRLELFGKVLVTPAVASAKRAFKRATAVTGITSEFVDWALRYAGRPRTSLDRHFPHAYNVPNLSSERKRQALEFWQKYNVRPQNAEFLVCYIGQLTATVEFDVVVKAARLLTKASCPIRFLFCGTGGHEEEFRERAANCSNITFTGWIGGDEIWTLMQMCAMGLLCYQSTFDYEASIPNKPVEYMAAGLPIVSSLQRGVLYNLLERHGCGLSYCNSRPDELAAILVDCYDRPDKVRLMSRRAVALFREQFQAGIVYGNMCDHLELIGERAKSGLLKQLR